MRVLQHTRHSPFVFSRFCILAPHKSRHFSLLLSLHFIPLSLYLSHSLLTVSLSLCLFFLSLPAALCFCLLPSPLSPPSSCSLCSLTLIPLSLPHWGDQ